MDRVKEILLELKKNNYSSFDEFYDLTNRLVYYMLAKFIHDKNIVEDLMQDTYVKFLDTHLKQKVMIFSTEFIYSMIFVYYINHASYTKSVSVSTGKRDSVFIEIWFDGITVTDFTA